MNRTGSCSPTATRRPWHGRCSAWSMRPQWAGQLGRRGYLQSDDGNVPDMTEHALAIEGIYTDLLSRRGHP